MTIEYEKRGELIRAPIRTKLGNVVMRWVRPDNVNIVVERNAAVPVPEPAPEFPKLYELCGTRVAGCCGATYLRAARAQKADVWTPEAIKAAWQKDWAYSVALYERYVAQYGPGTRNGTYYADLVKEYGLESYTKQKRYLTRTSGSTTITKPGRGNGVTISPDPFEGYTLRTPAGWYLRMDRSPVNKKTDDSVEPNEKPTFKAKAPVYAGASMPFSDDTKSWCLSGMTEGQHSGYSMMGACKAAGVPVGAKVLAIFNQDQHNSNGAVTPRSVAAAGFRLVLKTGNHNHPGHSTLYVYERLIQAGDYDEI